MLPSRLPIVPATPRVMYVRSRVKRCAGSAGRRCRRCARGQHERAGGHAKQAVQRRQGTTLQGCDSAKSGKCTGRQHAPQAQDPTNRKPYNLAPAARGRYRSGARRREGASCGTRPIQCPRWGGAQPVNMPTRNWPWSTRNAVQRCRRSMSRS